jgi:hypothetical protein
MELTKGAISERSPPGGRAGRTATRLIGGAVDRVSRLCRSVAASSTISPCARTGSWHRGVLVTVSREGEVRGPLDPRRCATPRGTAG